MRRRPIKHHCWLQRTDSSFTQRYPFRSDQRTGCNTAPKPAIAQINNSMASAITRKNAALMSCKTGIIVPPSACSNHWLRHPHSQTQGLAGSIFSSDLPQQGHSLVQAHRFFCSEYTAPNLARVLYRLNHGSG
jgi:hypothetical protein